LKHVKDTNSESQSNGSLMRCSPLAIYCHKLQSNEIA
jgi:ADP-ribosylglycohydrolase